MSTAQVSCRRCGTQFEVDTRYFERFGSDPFCQNCLIHTECQSCNRGLRLEPAKYREIGGEPVVCVECGDTQPSATTDTESGSATFWAGLTIGEKLVFPVLLVAFVGLAGLAIFAEMNGGRVETPLLGGLLFLLLWIYHRGSKNSPGS